MNNIIFVILLMAASIEALACSCVLDLSDNKEAVNSALRESDIVISAKAISVRSDTCELEFETGMESVKTSIGCEKIIFNPLEVWKGNKKNHIKATSTHFACPGNESFGQGQLYLVYLKEVENEATYSTGGCTRTKLLSEAKFDVEILSEK